MRNLPRLFGRDMGLNCLSSMAKISHYQGGRMTQQIRIYSLPFIIIRHVRVNAIVLLATI